MKKQVSLLNVKQDNTSPDYAEFLLDMEIKQAKVQNVGAIIVIHGYGSSGRGGIMKQQIHEYLEQQKKFGYIIDFVKGEQWTDHNPVAIKMKQQFNQLLINSQIEHLNSGVSIVWVN